MSNSTFKKYQATKKTLQWGLYRVLCVTLIILAVIVYVRAGDEAQSPIGPAFIGLCMLLFIGVWYERRLMRQSLKQVVCPKCQTSLFTVFEFGRLLQRRYKLMLESKPISVEYCPFCGCRLADISMVASQ